MGLYRKLRISSIQWPTDDCKTFFLQPVDQAPLNYQAGQFLTFVFSKPAGEERRSYSISSAPLLNEPLSITVKRLENGEYSRKLVDYGAVGDELTCTGAAGFFILPGNLSLYRQFFFMAAGTGITPVLPLIKTLLFQHPHTRVVLIYSNRSPAAALFYDELQQLLKQFRGRLVIEFLFSSAVNLARARLGKGLLAELLLQHHAAPLAQALFYTCGPFDYMRMVNIVLLENRVQQQQIKKEVFSTPALPAAATPPDMQPHLVVIQLQGQRWQFETRYPQTILEAAKNAGIQMPYSCSAGRCGSCAATCVQGKVWMSYNEVLMEDEIAKGRVLTCTGYPAGGDIELHYE